jgi:glycosyltransferase involved in cell wall biosynthesis
MRAKVAVITPTKNRLRVLCETMNSVQAQTFGAWEHIIVDDGSDDGTAKEVRGRAENDPRVRYIERNGSKAGASVCRNLGVAKATAEFVVFLDSDDLLEPDCLGRRVSVIERNPDADFVTFQGGVFIHQIGDYNHQPETDLLGDDLLRFLSFETPWIITGPIWRRTSLVRAGLFDETLLSWQDVELHVRALTRGARYIRFADIDHHVRWQFDDTKVSVGQRRSRRHLDAAIQVFETLEKHVRCGPGMNWVRQRALCSLYFFVAERWIERRDLSSALASWRRIRTRGLGPKFLYFTGALLLVAQAMRCGQHLGQRVAHKWKGWMRLRINPELVVGYSELA